MLKFIKGEGVKHVSEGSDIIPRLRADGWVVEGETLENADDLEALRAEAIALGLNPHHKAGAAKLKEMIEAAR
jgi:hypothetical protein